MTPWHIERTGNHYCAVVDGMVTCVIAPADGKTWEVFLIGMTGEVITSGSLRECMIKACQRCAEITKPAED